MQLPYVCTSRPFCGMHKIDEADATHYVAVVNARPNPQIKVQY